MSVWFDDVLIDIEGHYATIYIASTTHIQGVGTCLYARLCCPAKSPLGGGGIRTWRLVAQAGSERLLCLRRYTV
jgi:hypothetical protein